MNGQILLMLFLGSAMALQQTPPRFRSGIDLVHIEVSVLDENRRVVGGLTPADFVVLEDGQPRRIAMVQEIDLGRSNTQVEELTSAMQSNALEPDRRLVVLLLDSAVRDLWGRARLREAATQIVNSLTPHDWVAIVFTGSSVSGQGFTTDRHRLIKAINRHRSTISNGASALLTTMDNVVSILRDTGERRKMLIYLGGGLRYDPSVLASPVAIGSAGSAQGQMSEYHFLINKIFANCARANINIYTFDVHGLTVDVKYRRLHREFLVTLANHTGGRAVINTNDLSPGVSQIMAENSLYYLLAYESPARGYRRLDVKVKRSGAVVRAQSSTDAVKPTVVDVFDSVLPLSDLPMAGSAQVSRAQSGRSVVTVLVRPDAAWLAEQSTSASCLLRINAYDMEGRRKATFQHSCRVEELEDEGLLVEMPLEAGGYQLRAVLTVEGTTGSLYLDLDVPKLRKVEDNLVRVP